MEAEKRQKEAEQARGASPTTDDLFQSQIAEEAVVASILNDPNAIADIVDIVKPEDFVTAPSARIYEVMAMLWEKRTPADLVTLSAALGDETHWFLELTRLMTNAAPGQEAYIVYHGRMVADLAARRRFMHSTQQAISDLGSDPSLTVESVLSRVNESVSGPTVMGQMVTFADAMDRTMDAVEREHHGEIVRAVTPTGFRELDEKLGGGFAEEDLAILAARPSVGKTAMATDFLEAASDVGQAVMFSTEMSTESVMRRMASRASGVPMDKVQMGRMSEEEYGAFRFAAESMRDRRILIDDTPGITTAQMKLRIQRAQANGRVSLVIFDYLELAGDKVGKGDNKLANMEHVIGELKKINRECHVPIVALSQVSRSVDLRPNKVPMMSDLRWAGMIEQTADKILLLYLHDYYVVRGIESYDPEREGVMEVHVGKNRNGATGLARLAYEPTTFRFMDMGGS